MERKEKIYFYNPNNKEIGELACYCWHKEDSKSNMTVQYFMDDGEIFRYSSFGYWNWMNLVEPTELSEEEFKQSILKLTELPCEENLKIRRRLQTI